MFRMTAKQYLAADLLSYHIGGGATLLKCVTVMVYFSNLTPGYTCIMHHDFYCYNRKVSPFSTKKLVFGTIITILRNLVEMQQLSS